MRIVTSLRAPAQSRTVTDRFYGLDRRSRTADGCWSEETNLSAREAPVFSCRAPRGTVTTLAAPGGILASGTLCLTDGADLYIGGTRHEGVALDPDAVPKTLVAFGAYILIFPDKVYASTADPADHGSMENTASADASVTPISYALCASDGTLYETVVTAGSAPASPVNGTLWRDTSAEPAVLKRYDAPAAAWTTVDDVCLCLGAPGIGRGFSACDGVEITGCAAAGADGSRTLAFAAPNRIAFSPAPSDFPLTQSTGTVTVKRTVPDMDFVCECGNRLWGCRAGTADGQAVNELLACRLGDFKNWSSFAGLASDSWRASCGTPGPFTGCFAYDGSPLFFKEGHMHRITVSSSGAHQVTAYDARGIRPGCAATAASANGRLYWLSRGGVYAFDGSTPACVSDALPEIGKSTAGTAGALGTLLYLSVRSPGGTWELLTYDTARGIWHREDALEVRGFCSADGTLYALDGAGRLLDLSGASGTPEEAVSWSAVSGVTGFRYPESKYLSRWCLRLRLGEGASAELALEYDSSGVWETVRRIGPMGLGSVTVPVRPRRCDHLRFRLSGTGEVRLYSVARILEKGSDVTW